MEENTLNIKVFTGVIIIFVGKNYGKDSFKIVKEFWLFSVSKSKKKYSVLYRLENEPIESTW